LAGYETRLLNEALAFGLAPESLPEFLGQQARWCLGCLQQLPLSSGPLHGRHRLLDRLFYLDRPVFWLTHLATIQILLAPILFWYFAVVAMLSSVLRSPQAVAVNVVAALDIGGYFARLSACGAS
jgi:cellulose synthase (UDP-forming)